MSRCHLFQPFSVTLICLSTLLVAARGDAGGGVQGALVVCGGGTLPDPVWNTFVELAGGEQSRLVVIPTASADDRLPSEESVVETWTQRGMGTVSVLHTRQRDRSDDREFLTPLRKATAVWFSGGQQSRIAAAYVGTALEEELHALLQRGGVIGGTSAGAAIMSRVMIAGGTSVPKVTEGFDFVPNAIIDQHFLARSRLGRLTKAVRQDPNRIGIGIDEGTAVIVCGETCEVIGTSFAVVISGPGIGQPERIMSYGDGETFAMSEFVQEIERRQWALVLHGGAGTLPSNVSEEREAAYRKGLADALSSGRTILRSGGTSLDAVETVIRQLEDDPLFNAGHGAVFNSAGAHELDASIMDGRTLDGGAVAGVSTVKNPISLARLVMNRTRHVLLAGKGAEQFATEQNVDRVANEEFSTEHRRRQWEEVQKRERDRGVSRFAPPRHWQYGTVGCVALDQHGDIAAGTSTGGLTNKKYGRVGDSPILGAGTYADNATCGISASGIGEQFIRHGVAAQISLLMRHRGWGLHQAAEYVMHERLRPADGGVIGLNAQGDIVWVFTTPGMFRAAADSADRFDVLIGDEDATSGSNPVP